MTALENGQTAEGATCDELREVAAYLQGVADAAAAFQAQSRGLRTLVDTKPCPPVWLTGTESSRASVFEVEHDHRDVGMVALDATQGARPQSLCAISLQPAVASRRTLPYGAALVSLPPYYSSHAPVSYPAVWSQRGGARLIDLDVASGAGDLYEAMDSRCCTLFFPNGPLAPSNSQGSPASEPQDQNDQIEGEFWENERQSAVKLRIPQLPLEWYSLTGSEDA